MPGWRECVLLLVGTTTLPSHIFSFFRQSANSRWLTVQTGLVQAAAVRHQLQLPGPGGVCSLIQGLEVRHTMETIFHDISSCCVSTARMCSVGVSGLMHSRSPQFARSRGSSWLAPALHQQDIVGLVDVILFTWSGEPTRPDFTTDAWLCGCFLEFAPFLQYPGPHALPHVQLPRSHINGWALQTCLWAAAKRLLCFSAFEVCFVVSSARMSDTCPKCFPPVLLTVLTCASWGHCFALCCWFWGMCVLGLLLPCSTHPCVLGLLLLCSVCCAGIGAMSACCVPS